MVRRDTDTVEGPPWWIKSCIVHHHFIVYTLAMGKSCTTQCANGCGFWFAGWLFTIGFAQLSFGKGLLALLLWPYYLGVTLAA